MKGLIVKDLMILKVQAKALLMILGCSVVMSFAFEPNIVICYMAVMAVMAAMGTIGYDEFDHGYSFLFTLPFERKTYAREKYLLAIGFGTVCMLIGAAVSAVLILATGYGASAMSIILPTCGVALILISLFSALLIPVKIKYNSEKGKTVQYIIFAVIMIVVFTANSILEKLGISFDQQIGDKIINMSPYLLFAIAFAITALIVCISIRISERIVMKKEY